MMSRKNDQATKCYSKWRRSSLILTRGISCGSNALHWEADKTIGYWTQSLFFVSDLKEYVISGVTFLFNFANDFAALSLFSVSIAIQRSAQISEKML